jgi:DNA-binding transcriptional LysR family regulator
MARIDTPRLEELDLNLLLALHWLLEEGGVRRAAARLGLSQPATSHALARLRALLGDPLLVTVGRAMVPTPRAQALRPAIADAIARLRAAIGAAMPFEPERATTTIRIACSDYIGTVVAAAWIARVSARAPGLDLTLRPLEPSAIVALASGDLDLALLAETALPNIPRGTDASVLVQRRVFSEEYECVVRRGHPLAGRRVDAKRFARLGHVLVSPAGSGPGVVDALLAARAAPDRRIAFRVPSFLMALPIVAATDCVATLPSRIVERAGGALVGIVPPFAIPGFGVLMAWHPSRGADPAHRWAREELTAALAATDRATPPRGTRRRAGAPRRA